jgi:hypothetical protein
MRRDIHTKRLGGNAYLGRGEAHAARRHAHGRNEIGAELHDRRVRWIHE